jgi:uroporphyrinogen-III synthase
MRLLVTRPEPDAAHTAQAVRARRLDVLLAPLFAVQTIAADLASSYDAVLMTSANAARALAAHPRVNEIAHLPCLTVGARSADAARGAGFTDVVSADGALGDLVETVAARFGTSHQLLYLAGEDRAGDLAGALARHGIAVETAVVYRAVAAGRLPPELTQALVSSNLDGALHYSPRSVQTLLRLAGEAGVGDALLDLTHYCLSDAVAAALREAGATRIKVAARPDENALLALL